MSKDKEKESKRKPQPLTAYQDQLAALTEAAERVNDAASVASEEIEALDRALLDIEPGLSVWTAPIHQSSTILVGEDGQSQTARREVKIGYGKLQKWGLLVSEVWSSSDGTTLASMVQPLRKADREVRLLAQPYLRSLLDLLLSGLNGAASQLPATA
jgi:hypothetical protein